jgi:hypothetical protein
VLTGRVFASDMPPSPLPVLASLYAAFIAFGSICSVYEGVTTKRPLWYIILDAVSNFGIFVLFILYWFPHAGRALGLTMPALYVFCLVWVVAWTPHNWKRVTAELPEMEESPLLKRILITVAIVFTYPAYYFGGLAAFRN